MKRIKYLLLPLITISLCSCSHYKAFILVTTNHGNQASMEYDEFEGEYVFKLTKKDEGEGPLSYWGSVELGPVDVTYIYKGEETLLFTISSGESVRDQRGTFNKGDKVKIIVKSGVKTTNGDFTFNLN